VEKNGNTAAETLGDQDIVDDPDPQIGHPHHQLATTHALSR
jgi:hypothetical protein